MKLARETLEEIANGRKATAAEVAAMTRELIALRDDEAKRDDGTVAVHFEHVGKQDVSGWFTPRAGRILRSQLHVGARISLAGRIYGIVAIDGHNVRVR